MKPLWGIDKTAELLGISPWTVRSYIRDGKLVPVRIGRRVLLEEAEIERFVSEGRDESIWGKEVGRTSNLGTPSEEVRNA